MNHSTAARPTQTRDGICVFKEPNPTGSRPGDLIGLLIVARDFYLKNPMTQPHREPPKRPNWAL